MNYAVVTFGCRVNQADSFALERKLRAAGGRAVPAEAAELVIVNSCTVTATADHGTRQTIRRIARVNPEARIVATGCYATRDAEQVAALPGVVAVVPNDDKEQLVARLLDAAQPVDRLADAGSRSIGWRMPRSRSIGWRMPRSRSIGWRMPRSRRRPSVSATATAPAAR